MTIDYETCLALKEAGFPQTGESVITAHTTYRCIESLEENCYCERCCNFHADTWAVVPTLSELIDGCGENFSRLWYNPEPDGSTCCWSAHGYRDSGEELSESGQTPKAALAALYLAIHGKENV